MGRYLISLPISSEPVFRRIIALVTELRMIYPIESRKHVDLSCLFIPMIYFNSPKKPEYVLSVFQEICERLGQDLTSESGGIHFIGVKKTSPNPRAFENISVGTILEHPRKIYQLMDTLFDCLFAYRCIEMKAKPTRIEVDLYKSKINAISKTNRRLMLDLLPNPPDNPNTIDMDISAFNSSDFGIQKENEHVLHLAQLDTHRGYYNPLAQFHLSSRHYEEF